MIYKKMLGLGVIIAGIVVGMTLLNPAQSEALQRSSKRLANGDTAVNLLTGVFNDKDVAGAFGRYVGPTYRQHNPSAADGRQAAISVLSALVAKLDFHYDVKRVLVDGDMVAVHSHVTTSPGDRGSAVVDIFRFEHGKVVEHWDVIQAVPETPQNSNSMF